MYTAAWYTICSQRSRVPTRRVGTTSLLVSELHPQSHTESSRSGAVTDGSVRHTTVTGNHPEAGRVGYICARVLPVWMIENVVRGHFPTKLRSLAQHEVLTESGAPDIYSGTFNNTLTGGAESACGRRGKGARIKKVIE